MGPITLSEFLGIKLDSRYKKVKLPQEKLLRIREIIKSFWAVVAISKRDLLSLLGHVNVAMRIIPHGRSFMFGLLDLSKSVSKLPNQVELDKRCQSEFRFWSCFWTTGVEFLFFIMSR